MRNAFAAELALLARSDDRIWLLTGDIGNRLFDPFIAEFGDRFLNCGIAEANMIGVAAGLALEGMRPFVYTIVPFATTRCLEQIRVDLCYHDLPVRIVGVGGGLAYGSLGPTHHACEDISLLRSLPGMTVVCPGDPFEVTAIVRATVNTPGPVYIRLGKKGEPCVHTTLPALEIGRGFVLGEGHDVCLLSTGAILPVARCAKELLDSAGVSAELVSFHTVKPLDEKMLGRVFRRFRAVVTIEEHSQIGGLGSAVAEWLADRSSPSAPLLRIACPDQFYHDAGSQETAREHFGLTPTSIAKRVLRHLNLDTSSPDRDPLQPQVLKELG